MKKNVTITYLEMNDRSWFTPSATIRPELKSVRMGLHNYEINRFFYSAVGREWYWIDRLKWSDQQWQDYAHRPEMETWIGYLNATPVGYFELEYQKDDNMEIAHFGLLKPFVGQGLGGIFLTHAVSKAWDAGAKRIWLHTCTLDHPLALSNYKARGFKEFKLETNTVDIPD